MENENNVIRELIVEIATLMKNFPDALERRAASIQATGKDPALASKLEKGADAMRDSGNIYLTWARHYAALSEGTSDAADQEDEADFGT
ncbi:MAG: hypothetical protein ACREI2_02815 [Nitrospiraceae bacterium]